MDKNLTFFSSILKEEFEMLHFVGLARLTHLEPVKQSVFKDEEVEESVK